MRETLRRIFGRGVFGTGWINALVCIALAVGVYFTNDIYDLLNHGPAVMILRTPLDDAIPVVRPFVIPYVSLNPLVYVTLIIFLLLRTRIFQSAALSMITAFLVSYAFYFFLQTKVLRPVLIGNDLFTRMINAVYSGDHPYNDFPSLHTSISTLLAVHWFRVNRRAGQLAAVWATLIVASTVLIKQHYLADVGAGLLLAFGVSWLYERVLPAQSATVEP